MNRRRSQVLEHLRQQADEEKIKKLQADLQNRHRRTA
jgi:hypothetical protein